MALGSSQSFTDASLYNSINEGMNFSGKFGSDQTIWYPASGYRSDLAGGLRNVGNSGSYWSASHNGYYAYYHYIYYNGYVHPSGYDNRAYGYSVRCVQE